MHVGEGETVKRVCWRNAYSRRRDLTSNQRVICHLHSIYANRIGVSLRGRRTGIYYCSCAAVGWATLLYISIYVFRMRHSKVMLVFG